MFESHNIMTESKNLFEGRDRIHAMGVWNSVPINLVVADTSGNIGYMLLSASPQRKNEYPYLGCHILDGTTSEHDWEGIVDVKTLPRGFNPEKGYYVTANQRIVPENSKFDIGASMVNTGRSVRIDQLLSEGIKQGKKFDANDMLKIQGDLVDVYARDSVPNIVSITNKVIKNPSHGFSKEEASDITSMLDLLKDFKGEFVLESIGASVYSYWFHLFHQSLLSDYTYKGN